MISEKLYITIVEHARQKEFYLNYGVADSSDGRFDMIVVHLFLLFRRLKSDPFRTKELSQAIFDLTFADMDKNLREMGVGDIGVNHRIKGMVKALYGRVAAYEKGITLNDTYLLEAAVEKNIYRKISPKNSQIKKLTLYIRNEAQNLENQSIDELMRGNLFFNKPNLTIT